MARRFLTLLLIIVTVSCRPPSEMARPDAASVSQTDAVEVTLLHLNDVYEISPLENGAYGGLARVATIRKQLLRENPNTFTFLAGDFISPSAIGTSEYDGKRINGAQMVAALNSVGVDYVTFGNHEFDLGYEPLQQRLNESAFTWISSNIRFTPSVEGEVKPFFKVLDGVEHPLPEYVILTVKSPGGRQLRIGVIALTIGSNQPPYVVWEDPLTAARRVVEHLKPQTDFVIALTHLSIDEDRNLAESIPDLKIILGGHEHTNMMFKVGETIISKADANARTVYIHRLRWQPSQKRLAVLSEVRTVDTTVPEDSATGAVVREWTERAFRGFRALGFDPAKIVATLPEPLDGRESSIRYRRTNLGEVIGKAMLAAAPAASIAIFNSGSVRLDDELRGTVTQYDIIRTLPFGGRIIEVEIKGGLLQRVLDAGNQNVGRGGYLQYVGVDNSSAGSGSPMWLVGGRPIDSLTTYRVVVSDYLFSGKEHGIEFFTRDNPGVVAVSEPDVRNAVDARRDIRLAVINYLSRTDENLRTPR